MLLFIILIFLSIYLFTLAPTILWGDPGKLTLFVYPWRTISFFSGGGHGLHTCLGLLFSYLPIADLAYTQNFLSGITSALALVVFYQIIKILTNSSIVSFIATLALGLSHMFWFISVINESYSLLCLTFLLQLYIFLLWLSNKSFYLILLWLICAIGGFLNHFLTGLFIPIFLLFFIIFTDRKKQTLSFFAIFAIISIIFLSLFQEGKFLKEFLHTLNIHFRYFFGKPHQVFKEFIFFPFYIGYQFPFLGSVLGLYGIYKALKTKQIFYIFLILCFIADLIFSSFYGKARQIYQQLPAYIIFAIFIGVALKEFNKKVIITLATLLIILPPLTYSLTPLIANKKGIYIASDRTLKYRDTNWYYLYPPKNTYYGAYKYAKEILDKIPSNSFVLADFTPSMVIRYLLAVKKYNPEVELFTTDQLAREEGKVICRNLERLIAKKLSENRRVYLADDECITFITEDKNLYPCWNYLLNKGYEIIKIDEIYEIRKCTEGIRGKEKGIRGKK